MSHVACCLAAQISSLSVLQASRALSGVEVSAWGAVRNWRTWYLAVINLCDATVKYAIIYWCPLIIYHMVADNMVQPAAALPHDAVVALLAALPFGFAALFMLVNARHSAATGTFPLSARNCARDPCAWLVESCKAYCLDLCSTQHHPLLL